MAESSVFPLGRHPDAAANHDPRSLGFPAQTDTPVTRKWRRYGASLDQGNLGSCTGNAGVGALNHAPFHVKGVNYTETDAVNLYSAATQVDPYPGSYPPTDTGSDGLTIAKVLMSRHLISGYTHAFGIDHVLGALMIGPLICGTNWYDGMFNPDSNAQVHPTGSVAGGHEYVCDGVLMGSQMLRFNNSWSNSWGKNGRFFMSFTDFSQLLSEGGDAILFGHL